ncbi:aminotransferase class IV [Thalassospira sp. NFXS8]|uniref:aminotransferase class IV n=1 Tax=Thalassospira sp. NFXS8 TaxID=2819093 RepID=UPI0032DE2D93
MTHTDFGTRDGFIWIDGTLVPWEKAECHILSHSLHMSGAVFEGMRAYNSHVFLGQAHLERLGKSAELVGYNLPWTVTELTRAIEAVIWANGLDDCYIRPVAWRGSQSVSVAAPNAHIHVAIAAWDWPTPARLGTATTGIRLVLADWRRPAPNTAPTASKCSGMYMIGTLARHMAQNGSFDDALMLDSYDNIAETTATNIVLIKDNRLISPLPICFLDSITKHHVFALAQDMKLTSSQQTVTLDMLADADEVFVVGTSVEILPVIELATRNHVYHWPVGALTKRLIAAFAKSVRVNTNRNTLPAGHNNAKVTAPSP